MLAFVTIVTFVIAAAVVLSLYDTLTAESPVSERLRRLIPEAAHRPRRGAEREVGLLRRLLAALGQYGFRREDASLAQRLSAAGLREPTAVAVFLGVRTLVSFGPAFLILVPQASSGKPLARTLWLAGVAWGTGHVLVNSWLRTRAQRRIRQTTEALPDALDLMVVCLEAGLGLNATIARVGEERATLNDPLGQEFAQVAFELRSGRSREEALRALADRNGVDDLKAMAALIIQSDRLGASMAKTLRVHADLVRTRRRQRADEAARKLPIKVLFPLATLLLPPLFIMVAGPAFLKFKELVKLIAGH